MIRLLAVLRGQVGKSSLMVHLQAEALILKRYLQVLTLMKIFLLMSWVIRPHFKEDKNKATVRLHQGQVVKQLISLKTFL